MRALHSATVACLMLVAVVAGAGPVMAQGGYPPDGYPQQDGYPEGAYPPDADPQGGYPSDGGFQSEPPPEAYAGDGPDGPPPDGQADFSEFHRQLQPYGEWIEHPQYGAVWAPYAQEQEPDWRPYTRGRWVLTEEHGWYWESEEPWGWATYHYGRWHFDPQDGWVWVPGSVWGPAWVAWRESDDAVGWIPLPPDAVWSPDRGIVYRSGFSIDGPRYAALWVFVGASALLAPRVYRHFYPRTRNSFYIGRSRHVTAYRFDNRRVFNRGINPRIVERRIGRPIAFTAVRPVGNAGSARVSGANRSFVGVYRPRIAPRAAGAPARPPFATRQPIRVPTNVAPRIPDRDRGLPRPDGREPWRAPGRSTGPLRESTPPRPPVERASRPPESVSRPDVRRAPPPEVRRSPPPEVRRSPPPEARRAPPPEARRAPPPEARRAPPPQRSGERREGSRKEGQSKRPEGDGRGRGSGG